MQERKTGHKSSRPPVRWTVFDRGEELRFASDEALLDAFRGRDVEGPDVRAAIAMVSEREKDPVSKGADVSLSSKRATDG